MLVAMFAACSPKGASELPPWGEVPEYLEQLSLSGAEAPIEGRFSVTGADRDFVLTHEDGTVLTVHSPTNADLTLLDGRVLSFESEVDGLNELMGPNWRASEDGEPLWMAAATLSGDLGDEWFGEGFATLGAPLAREFVAEQDVFRDHHAVRFASDDGPVEVVPGSVDTVWVEGAPWRVGVVHAYVQGREREGSKCDGASTAVSYELLRVEVPEEPHTVERRGDGALQAVPSCG